MPKDNMAASAGGMLDNLKSRLGFSHDKEDDEYSVYDDYDEYDEYSEYGDGYSRRGDNEYAGYGADYNESAPVGAFRPASTAHSSRFGRADSTPNLVSIDDVKARTQVPNDLLRDPLDDRVEMRPSRNGRNFVENGGPAESSPAYNAAQRDRERYTERTGRSVARATSAAPTRSRSEGLDSLFEPSGAKPAASTDRTSSSYDPYEAYSGAGASTYTGSRSLTVIRPYAYNEVERVARALKAGDVVVLAMRATPDDLSKRVLDFSFGAAAALDASVECPADKVFAIARGMGLSEAEKNELRSQGVL